MNIEINIDEIVLRDFPPGNRHRIGMAIEQELTRLLTENMPTQLLQGGDLGYLSGGTFEMTPDTPSETIGARIAQTVYGGFEGSKSSISE